MATLTQAEAIQYLKNRVRQLKEENAELKNENEELNEAISYIYDTAAGFSKAKQDDFEDLDFNT